MRSSFSVIASEGFNHLWSKKIDRKSASKMLVKLTTEEIGLNNGNCEMSFSSCPLSIYNFVPIFDPDNEDIVVTFDSVQSGSTSKPIFEENLNELFNSGI